MSRVNMGRLTRHGKVNYLNLQDFWKAWGIKKALKRAYGGDAVYQRLM
jgi:hypothetical protein